MRQKKRPVELPRIEQIRLPFIPPDITDDELEEEEALKLQEEEEEAEAMRFQEEAMRLEEKEALLRLEESRRLWNEAVRKEQESQRMRTEMQLRMEEEARRYEEKEEARKFKEEALRLTQRNKMLRKRENDKRKIDDKNRTQTDTNDLQSFHNETFDNVEKYQSENIGQTKVTLDTEELSVTIPSDREVLLNYYNELLLQNEISECKRRKVSDTDSASSINNHSSDGILNLSVETRNAESALDSPMSSVGESTESDVASPSKPSPSVAQESQASVTPIPSGPEQGSYPCPKCDKSFAYVGNLKRHIKMHHGEYRPYKCHLCVKRFWGNDSLEQHIKRVHSREKPYECAHCDKKYSVCYDLQKHVRSVHGKDIDWRSSVPSKSPEEIPKTASGEKCKVTGIKTQALDQLNFKCKFCGRGFATVNGLGVHLKMHFRCKVCFKGFNTEESLRIHLQKAHDIVGDQEYVL